METILCIVLHTNTSTWNKKKLIWNVLQAERISCCPIHVVPASKKGLSVRPFLCGKVSRNHIPFGTSLSAILIFLLPPFPRRTSLALANSSNLTSWIYLFLGNRRDGREVCSSKRSPNSVCRQSRVSCSIVLWCPNQLPLILRKPSNTEWYKCLLLLHGNKSLRLMLSKKKVWRANNAAHAYCNGIEPNFQYYQMRRILCVQRVYWRKTASGALTYVNGYTSPPLLWKVSKKVSQSINQGLQSLGKEYVVWSKKIKVVFQL